MASYVDHRGGHLPCIRRGRKETCLCTNDRSAQSSVGMFFRSVADLSISPVINQFCELEKFGPEILLACVADPNYFCSEPDPTKRSGYE